VACNNSGTTVADAIAVDASGNFYLAGITNGSALPTTAGVIQPSSGPLYNSSNTGNTPMLNALRGFVAKFNPVTAPGGASLAYATYLGGTTAGAADMPHGITTDADGNSYITGMTISPDFPVTPGAYQTSCALDGTNIYCGDADFVTKLNPTGTSIVWSTYVGVLTRNDSNVSGSGPIQLDANGNVYIIGSAAGNFPTLNPVESTFGGNAELFVFELDPTGSKLLFSTPVGGNGVGKRRGPGRLAPLDHESRRSDDVTEPKNVVDIGLTGRRKVLVAEDEQNIANLVRIALEREGFQAVMVRGLELLPEDKKDLLDEEIKKSPESVHDVLMDFFMVNIPNFQSVMDEEVKRVKDQVEARPCALLHVKGKSEAVDVYEVVGLK